MKVHTTLLTSKVPKATNAETQSTTASVANKYISPYTLKEWFAWVRGLSWVWSKKQNFSEGLNIGNNPNPTNGDFWFDGTNFWARRGGVSGVIPTGNTGGFGRVFHVSTTGSDSTGTMGSSTFTYATPQAAINASLPGDTIVFHNSTFTQNVTLNKPLTIILNNAHIVGRWDMTGLNMFTSDMRIVGIGNARLSNSIGTGHLFDNWEGGIGNIYIEGVQITCTGTCFRRTVSETGYVRLKRSFVSCGTFMSGSWYGGSSEQSILIASAGRGFALYALGSTFSVRNSYIETQGACAEVVVGSGVVQFDVENSTLWSKTFFCLVAQNYIAGTTPYNYITNSTLRTDSPTHNTIFGHGSTAVMGGDLKMRDVEMIQTASIANHITGFAGYTQFNQVVGNRNIMATAPNVPINVFPNQNITFTPRQPPF